MADIVRTFEYRRAQFEDNQQNLENLIRGVWQVLNTQSQRTITYSDSRSISGLSAQEFSDTGFAIHCAVYTEGQSVGVINKTPAPQVEISELEPRSNENFVNSDLMALIKDNHIISMNCGRNAGSLRIFLQHLFAKANLPDPSRQFKLMRIGSPDKLALIATAGVRTIDLKVSISEITADQIREHSKDEGIWAMLVNRIGGTIDALTAKDCSLEQIRQAEKANVTMSLNVPNNDLEPVKNAVNKLAKNVLNDDDADAFVIHLRNGDVIRPNEVSVRKQVRLSASANTVSVVQAWQEMRSFMRELMHDGQLEV